MVEATVGPQRGEQTSKHDWNIVRKTNTNRAGSRQIFNLQHVNERRGKAVSRQDAWEFSLGDIKVILGRRVWRGEWALKKPLGRELVGHSNIYYLCKNHRWEHARGRILERYSSA